MDELDRLLAGIIAAPDDDAARLVYADALLEHGDPRGELIVLQVSGGDPDRERELLDAHANTWLGELAPIVKSFRFERGFLAACTVAAKHRATFEGVSAHPMWSTVRELTIEAEIGEVEKAWGAAEHAVAQLSMDRVRVRVATVEVTLVCAERAYHRVEVVVEGPQSGMNRNHKIVVMVARQLLEHIPTTCAVRLSIGTLLHSFGAEQLRQIANDRGFLWLDLA